MLGCCVIIIVVVIIACWRWRRNWWRIRGEVLVKAVVCHGCGGSGCWYIRSRGLLYRILAVNVAYRADLVPQNSENRFVKITKAFLKLS